MGETEAQGGPGTMWRDARNQYRVLGTTLPHFVLLLCPSFEELALDTGDHPGHQLLPLPKTSVGSARASSCLDICLL